MQNIENIKIFKNPGGTNCTASIHKTGRLGFSAGTIKLMNLDGNKHIKIGQIENEKDIFYLFVLDKEDDESFKVISAGSYFYLNTTFLFDELKIDYRNGCGFKVTKVDDEKKIFKLTKKQSNVKKKTE